MDHQPCFTVDICSHHNNIPSQPDDQLTGWHPSFAEVCDKTDEFLLVPNLRAESFSYITVVKNWIYSHIVYRIHEMYRFRKSICCELKMKRLEIVILPWAIYHIELQWRHVDSGACQITGNFTVCSTICSSTHQRIHQSSTSLAFVMGTPRWPVDSLHTGPVTRKIFSFDDVIMVYQMTSYIPSIFHCHIQCIYVVVFTEFMSACIFVFVRARGPSQYKDVVLPV